MFAELKSKHSIIDSLMILVKSWADSRSKDPSTKVGACVYDTTTGGIFLGYNGFPSAVKDLEMWWNARTTTEGSDFTKYDLCIHAEMNACMKALRCGANLRQSYLIVTHHPCINCARDLICTSGFLHVYYESDELKLVTSTMREKVKALLEIAGIPITKLPPSSQETDHGH